MKITIADWDARATHFEFQAGALAKHVARTKAELVVLPEMAFTPWLAYEQTPDQVAWQASVHEHEMQIAALAQITGCAIAGSRPIVGPTGNRNQGYIFSQGAFAKVRHEKRALPAEEWYWEAHWYEDGQQDAAPVTWAGLRFGFAICTELWDSAHGQRLMQGGTEVILAPRATPDLGDDVWVAGVRALAVQTGCYVLSANFRYPRADGFMFEGLSAAADPDGKLLGLSAEGIPFVTVEVQAATAQSAKKGYPRYIFERLNTD